MRRVRAGAAVVAIVCLAAGACGRSGDASPTTATTTAPASADAGLTGDLTVFAAASLTGAFQAARSAFATSAPGLHLATDFAGSNALATQISQGADADVFASADAANMQKLVAAGLVDAPVVFARNALQIAVAPGNPKRITGLRDLGRSDVAVVLAAIGVPAGDYARQVLDAQHVTVAPRSLETDVKSAMAKVTSGEADATVVYVTDVLAAKGSAQGVPVPDADQPAIEYPIAVVKATRHQAAAEAFIRSARAGAVHEALVAAGFRGP